MKELYLESAKGGTSHEQNRCIGLHKQKKEEQQTKQNKSSLNTITWATDAILS